MTPKRAFKGVWIPAFIWTSTELSWIEKALLAEIDSLDDEEHGCFASNKYLAQAILSTSAESVAVTISKLRKSGWIIDNPTPPKGIRSISIVKSQKEREALTGVNGALTGINPKEGYHIYNESTSREMVPSQKDLIETQTIEAELYSEYPKKMARPAALRAIKKALRNFKPDFLLQKVKEFAKLWEDAKDLTFCPHPATWFNEERFNDDPSTWGGPTKEDPRAELRRLENIRDGHICHRDWVKHDPNAPQAKKDEYRKIKARIKELEQLTGQ